MIKKYFQSALLMASIAVFFAACKKDFNPGLKNIATNYLVVDGYIDGGAPTIITLSRTRPVTKGDTSVRVFEEKASVWVEDNQKNKFSLAEQANGRYSSITKLALNPSYQYRIVIKTEDNKEYVSKYESIQTAPGIDKVYWDFFENGVQIKVDTHDDINSLNYYRWEYDETWQFKVPYKSVLKYDSVTRKIIDRVEDVQTCWKNDNAGTKVIIANTDKLTAGIISQQPIIYIPEHDDRLSILYSINVKQFTMSPEEYQFWEVMKQNTDQLGGLFDRQPNQTRGNIECTTNPSEYVIGYIGVGFSTEKRIFISNSTMPGNWNLPTKCELVTVPSSESSIRSNFAFYYYIPVSSVTAGGLPAAYTATTPRCADCTFSGNSQKPSFWP